MLATLEINQIVVRMKEQAQASQASIHRIVAQVTIGISDAVKRKLPSIETLKRTARRQRALQNPLSLEDLVIPDKFKRTLDGDGFLLYDSEQG